MLPAEFSANGIHAEELRAVICNILPIDFDMSTIN
jgi:hypothetical protein